MTQLKQENQEQSLINTSNLQNSIPVGKRQRLIFQVDEGHNSKQTEAKYRNNFKHFLDYIRIHDLDVLLDLGKEAIQELVIKYAISLRDNPEKKYKRGTVHNRIASILYFFENNDIELNKRKIRRYYPPDESVNDDRSYTTEEIQRILSVCDLRTKAMILLMASTGVRIGALYSMMIGDLTEVEFRDSKLYKVQVYARTRDKYSGFTTPECYNAIQEYLNYRKRCGEDLKDKSALFRRHFNKDDPFTINVPEFLTEGAVMKVIDRCLKRSGVKTSDSMRSHAFRKGFMSICERSGMKSINVKMLLGHDIGVSGHYYRPAESDLLEDYMTHAVDALTISAEHRLTKQVEQLQVLEAQHMQDYEYVKKKMYEFQDRMAELEDQVRKPLTKEEYRKKYFEGENPVMDYQDQDDDKSDADLSRSPGQDTLGRNKPKVSKPSIGQKKPNGEDPGKAEEKAAERSFFEIE